MNADLSIFTVTSFPVRLWNKLFMSAEHAGPENLSPFLFCNKGEKSSMTNGCRNVIIMVSDVTMINSVTVAIETEGNSGLIRRSPGSSFWVLEHGLDFFVTPAIGGLLMLEDGLKHLITFPELCNLGFHDLAHCSRVKSSKFLTDDLYILCSTLLGKK